jgi:hypothetical protein
MATASQSDRRKDLEVLITRVSYYLTAPLITQMNCAAIMIAAQVYDRIPLVFEFWDTFGSGIPGVLNLITFCMDPAFLKGINTIRCQSKFNAYPHATANFTPVLEDRPQYISNPLSLRIIAGVIRVLSFPFSCTDSNMMVVTDQTQPNSPNGTINTLTQDTYSEKKPLCANNNSSSAEKGDKCQCCHSKVQQNPEISFTSTHSTPLDVSSPRSEHLNGEMEIFHGGASPRGEFPPSHILNGPNSVVLSSRRILSDIGGDIELGRNTPLDANHSWRLEDREFIDQVQYEEYLKSL